MLSSATAIICTIIISISTLTITDKLCDSYNVVSDNLNTKSDYIINDSVEKFATPDNIADEKNSDETAENIT